ncbi:AraC family transcriptional regulator [Pendulispora albinea]|uniref:AraC family transcriptional regulator n=1 Tax=Pendulispora albinea TaxID=2741071 RepID=A0ABZ2LP76_9BACT
MGVCHDSPAIWVDDALARTEYLSAHYRDFRFPPHMHETFAIGVIECGGQRFRPERRSALVMPAGTLCVINPGVVHEGRAATEGGWGYRMFYPSEALVARALAGEDARPRHLRFPAHVIDDRALFAEFSELHAASRHGAIALEREVRLIAFLHRLFARHADSDRTEPEVAGARVASVIRDCILDESANDIRVAHLAAEAGVSEAHAIRSFSKVMGMPPHAFLIAVRVERAKSMIRAGLRLAEVASSTGFFDQSQMTHHFRRLTGITPGRYARETHGAREPHGANVARGR